MVGVGRESRPLPLLSLRREDGDDAGDTGPADALFSSGFYVNAPYKLKPWDPPCPERMKAPKATKVGITIRHKFAIAEL